MFVEVCNEGVLTLKEFNCVVHTIGDRLLFKSQDILVLK